MKKTILLCFVMFSLAFLEGCINNFIRENMQKGDMIVRRIEDYKVAHDSLPGNLLDIIQSEYVGEVLFCYEKVNDSSYVVWFGTTLGEGMYYYSDTKKWEDKCRSIK